MTRTMCVGKAAGIFFVLVSLGFVDKGYCELIDSDFIPQVSATCKQEHMSIRVAFNGSFNGAVHARDFRTPACMSHGDGGKLVTLDINLAAQQGSPDYCGLLVNNRTDERSVPIAVRIHKTLELADDKFYVITCGKASFKNAKNETSSVSLKILDGTRKVAQTVYSKSYTLRAEISRPDGIHGFRVKNCIVFNKFNTSAPLIDENGCPADKEVISQFAYNDNKGYATAEIKSMFRFSEGSDVHFQCDIGLCRGACPDPSCNGAKSKPLPTDEGVFMASTSVFVIDPGQAPLVSELCDDVGGVRPSWLLWLCITLGVLFLIMLIINIFLCSAMTCACTSTEIIDKEPSIIEDYDPYRSWHGSQYGSRYSLNGPPQHPKGYTSGGSTMNSARSVSSHSDHYAIVHSRPGSRYKNRGPPSHVGSHYSGK
ncbi:uncharacterized protein LOC123313883 isoform X1 [Coccinella septempunctata]|uniref:uncharacterized protein LOC123313883 isoform X1 n=1 Tax=Coccinella septempunctata TaxID=41139 RepID=UPI001D07962A|nr:uncharacterized protein LOC123313883 isoform X1 [Coccinella septempunctata]